MTSEEATILARALHGFKTSTAHLDRVWGELDDVHVFNYPAGLTVSFDEFAAQVQDMSLVMRADA